MITVHFVGPGEPIEVRCKTGQSLMQAAVTADIDGIAADCGGMLTCATCHVHVQEPYASMLEPPSADELGMLEYTASPREPNSRLSCQIELHEGLDGLTVVLPPSQY